jgi:plasmid stabilization system protein ParE
VDQRDNELLATLELNEDLTNFVREELEGGRSFVDYLRWLVKRDRWNRIKKVVGHLIGGGIESGSAEPLTADYWTRIIPGFVARDPKELIGESWPISCRPMVAEDLKTLLAEIAPDSDEAAGRFLQTTALTIAAIGRKPARGCMMAGYEPNGLMIHPVGGSVARVAYLVTLASGIDVVRVLHRDKHHVLERHIDSAWDLEHRPPSQVR